MEYIKNHKRITIFAGHYGSGKTNLAVNFAKDLKRKGEDVLIADLDIVNPYFRTKDSEKDFNEMGIDLVCSSFASGNLDIPALPANLYRIVRDKNTSAVLDIGGDDAGSVVLGRLSKEIIEENNYEMIFVVNFFRPLTKDAESAMEIMREIEFASSMKFTAIVNNSNLGSSSKIEDLLSTENEIKRLCEISSLPLLFTSAESKIFSELKEKTNEAFSLELQKKLI